MADTHNRERTSLPSDVMPIAVLRTSGLTPFSQVNELTQAISCILGELDQEPK